MRDRPATRVDTLHVDAELRAAPRRRSPARSRRRALARQGRIATGGTPRRRRSSSRGCSARTPTLRPGFAGPGPGRSTTRHIGVSTARSRGYGRRPCSSWMHQGPTRRQYRRRDHTHHSRLLHRGARVDCGDPDRRRERPVRTRLARHVPRAGQGMGARSRPRSVGLARLCAEGLEGRPDPRPLLRRHDRRHDRSELGDCASACCAKTTST